MQSTYRLHKVMEYRELAESWCREAYLDARAARLEAETHLLGNIQKRAGLLDSRILTVEETREAEARLKSLDEEEIRLRTVLQVLEANEKRLHAVWTEKLRDLQALQLLSLTADGTVEPVLSRDEQVGMAEWSARQAS